MSAKLCNILQKTYLAVRRKLYVGSYSACLRSLKFRPSKSVTATLSRLVNVRVKGFLVKIRCRKIIWLALNQVLSAWVVAS
jgi:hypothetical protein